MADYTEGQTATDHKTGERVVFTGGQWQAMPGQNTVAVPKLSQGDQATLKADRDGSARNSTTLAQLNAFDQYNNRVRPTGDMLNRAQNYVSGMMGNSDVTGMDQITSAMARQQRQPGEGSTDHWEGLQYLKQVGGTDKSYDANRQWSQRTRTNIQNLQARYNFRAQWAAQHGTVNGADQAFTAQQQRTTQSPPSPDGYSITPVN